MRRPAWTFLDRIIGPDGVRVIQGCCHRCLRANRARCGLRELERPTRCERVDARACSPGPAPSCTIASGPSPADPRPRATPPLRSKLGANAVRSGA
eukprot:10185978-Alexandrium_andersonii.AAC.1